MTATAFFQSYLFAWVFWTTLTLGCTGLLLLHHSVQGSWGLVILRLLEAGTKLLPIMALLFIPILFNVWTGGNLYHWVHPDGDKVLMSKTWYLNPFGFTMRFFVYFLIWTTLVSILNRSSLRQDRNGDKNEAQMRANVGAFGLVLFVLSVTFAYTDWVMSLDAHWFSTIFGAWFLVGMGLSALAFTCFYVTRRAGKEPWKRVMTPQFTRDIGNLLLTFVMLWGYFSLSQFLIIYSGNLPEETTYYYNRMNDRILNLMGGVLLLGQWLIPLLCLLSSRTKREPKLLMQVAGFILVMRFIDILWTIAPFFKEAGEATIPTPNILLHFVMATVLGGMWVFLFTANMKRESALPTHDPRLQGATSHG